MRVTMNILMQIQNSETALSSELFTSVNATEYLGLPTAATAKSSLVTLYSRH